MSKFYFIKPYKAFDPQKLLNNVTKWHGVKFQNPNYDEWLFWVENESTRGVEVTYDDPYIEICVFILSNHIDYQLVNWIGQAIAEEFGGICENEDQNINLKAIISLTSTQERFENDFKVVSSLAKRKDTITIYGPHRPVYIGYNFISRLETMDDAAMQLELWILHLQYKLPLTSGSYIEIKHPDEPKYVKTLQLNDYQIIGKFDYLAIETGSDEVCIITNDDLNTILPDTWILIDEYTIEAQPLNQKAQLDLLHRALPMNRIDELND